LENKVLYWYDRRGKRLSFDKIVDFLADEEVNEVRELPTEDDFRKYFGPKPVIYWEPSSKLIPKNSKAQGNQEGVLDGKYGAFKELQPFPDGAKVVCTGLPKHQVLPAPARSSTSSGSDSPRKKDAFFGWKGLGEIPKIFTTKGFECLLVLGPSGSGKTSLLKNLIKTKFPRHKNPLIPKGKWEESKSIIDSFPDPDKAVHWLGSIGLSSLPTYCKPWKCLSKGDQYRASVALQLASRKKNEPVIFDEWTSVLDRGFIFNSFIHHCNRTELRITLIHLKRIQKLVFLINSKYVFESNRNNSCFQFCLPRFGSRNERIHGQDHRQICKRRG